MMKSLVTLVALLATTSAEVLVVGGGLAGLSATVELVEAGIKVRLIEGEKDVGGNSAKASSGMNAVGTEAQRSLNIKDSTSEFIRDTLKAGDEGNKKELVQILVKQSKDAVKFITSMGVNLGDVNLCGGHSHPRTHWVPSPKEGRPLPVGIAIIRALKGRLDTLAKESPDLLTISLNTTATELLLNKDGAVTGLKVVKEGKEESLKATAVILTSGGFGNDHNEDSLLTEFAAEKEGYPTTNGAFAQGKGVRMGRAIGAKLRDMADVQVHPTAFVDPAAPSAGTKFLAAEALRGKGALLLNDKGQRFANELGRRDYLTGKIEANCPLDEAAGRPVAWMLMNSQAVESFGWPAFNFYFKIKKFFTAYADLDALAEGTGMDDTNLLNTFHVYQQLAKGDAQDVYGKTVFPAVFKEDEGPFYAAKVTPAIHYTMGGLEIDELARVLREEDGEVIPGLMAAGEVSAGVHGHNRLAGNSLLECVVFGRIAAKTAAQVDQKRARSEL